MVGNLYRPLVERAITQERIIPVPFVWFRPNDSRITLALIDCLCGLKPQDKEAEAVNELQRGNGAQQTRPMRAEVARRRRGLEARALAGADGAELQKRWAWLVVMLAAGRWVAKRGWPAASSTKGRVGRLWLRGSVGA